MYEMTHMCVNFGTIMLKLSINTVEKHGMIFHLLNFIRNTSLDQYGQKCDHSDSA
jgi:hypothetical protein